MDRSEPGSADADAVSNEVRAGGDPPEPARAGLVPRVEESTRAGLVPCVEESTRADRTVRFILAAALVLGLLRFVRLGQWSLWIDESLTWADIHHGIVGGEIHNPLGYWLIGWTVDLFGGTPTEWSLRVLPAFAGWLCVPATFLAFRGLFGARRASAASLLIAVSSWHLYWSQNARFYTFAQLAMLVGVWILGSALMGGRPVRAVIGLAVAASGALFHPSAVLVLPALGLVPFVLQRVGRPIALTSTGRRAALALAIVSLVGIALGLGWISRSWSTYAYQKGVGGSLADVLASIAHFAKTTGFFVTPLLGTALLCGVWFAVRSKRGTDAFAALVVLSAIACAVVAAALVRVSAQYVFVVLPWIALVAVLPIGEARPGPFGRRGELAWLLVLVLPALATCGLYLTTRAGERPAYREAFQFAANVREPDEMIFGTAASIGEFYLAPGRTDLRRTTALCWLDRDYARVPEYWARRGRGGLYVVNPEEFVGWNARDAADFQRYLREECRLVASWPLYVESRDLSVLVYRRD